MVVEVLGVRHYSPGCARALLERLVALRPEIVLVEGPPDAQPLLPALLHDDMVPPVALLIYAARNPGAAAVYPFAVFSPEWHALRYALATQGCQARLADLPMAVYLASPREEEERGQDEDAPESPWGDLPLAAGYSSEEVMWEHLAETRLATDGLLDAVVEMAAALQGDAGPPPLKLLPQREAAMRQAIRDAQREGFVRIAVVCGAAHAPALKQLDQEKADAALLRGLPRTEVEASWIPWTYSRLTRRSGYGSGVQAPGWCEHLWLHPGPDRAPHWMSYVASVLREAGFGASPALVIEAVHLAQALAELRGLSAPGLLEFHQATEVTLCHGASEPLHLVRDRLEIGDRQGSVPSSTLAVALQRDLELQQKKLRLAPSAEPRTLDLDLRGETDLARSRLLHRLNALGVPWGEYQPVSAGKQGTFHEIWRLEWRPELALCIIEANVWGTTVGEAATARLVAEGSVAQTLPRLTDLLSQALFSDLADAIKALLASVEAACAHTTDEGHLIDALLPLARVARYGDARQTRLERLAPVIEVLFERAVIGLPHACLSLDDAAARTMLPSIDRLQESVLLLSSQERSERWFAVLRQVSELGDRAHGLVRGRCVRLLLDQRQMSGEDLLRLASLVLSPLASPGSAASWVEGVVRGSVTLLLHQEELWTALDAWLTGLEPDVFLGLLPLLRRAFASFGEQERLALREKVQFLSGASPAGTARASTETGNAPPEGSVVEGLVVLDVSRANAVLPVLEQILKEKKSHGHRR